MWCQITTADGFRSSWRKAVVRAGVVGRSFHDLRGSTVSRMALAGATVPEIAAVSGHSLKTAAEMIEVYLARDSRLGPR